MAAARTERSATAQRAIAAAAAAIARHAPDARVVKLLAEAMEMYTQPGDAPARLLAGLLCKEVARGAGDAFAKHAAQVPAAGQQPRWVCSSTSCSMLRHL